MNSTNDVRAHLRQGNGSGLLFDGQKLAFVKLREAQFVAFEEGENFFLRLDCSSWAVVLSRTAQDRTHDGGEKVLRLVATLVQTEDDRKGAGIELPQGVRGEPR